MHRHVERKHAAVSLRSLRGRLLVYPLCSVAAITLTAHSDAGEPLETLIRPLAVLVALTAVLQGMLTLALRNGPLAAALAFSGVAIAADPRVGVPVAMVLIFIGSQTDRGFMRLGRVLNRLSLVLLIVSTAAAAYSGSLTPMSDIVFPIDRAQGRTTAAAASTPDIYLILVDGYPDPGTLTAEFDISIEPFITELEELGFVLPGSSRSNYNLTALSLASMFNYEHVANNDVIDPSLSPPAQYRSITRAINQGKVFPVLREHGYEIITSASAFGFATLYSADKVHDDGQPTRFEYMILRHVAWMLPAFHEGLIAESHRDRLRSNFRHLEQIAHERAEHPRFVFAHVMAPHAPLVFDGNGQAQELFPCYPAECSIWDTGYRHGAPAVAAKLSGHIEWLNQEVLRVSRTIQAQSSGSAVIILVSDHGFRHEPMDKIESTSSFLAVHAPGTLHLPAGSTVVNLLPRILNTYLGEDLPLSDDSVYWVDINAIDAEGPLKLVPVRRLTPLDEAN